MNAGQSLQASIAAAIVLLLAPPAVAERAATAPAPVATAKPPTLDVLLQRVKDGWRAETEENRKREQAFVSARRDKKALLEKARSEKNALERQAAALEHSFERYEVRMAELEETLRVRLGTMGELFGVIRQVAGDTRSHLEGSLVSAQFPGRATSLDGLTQSRRLPSIAQLEQLWFVLQQEMIEAGKVVRFSAPVVTADGAERESDVIRVGSFNAVSGGKYLRWMPSVGKLAEQERQPPVRYLSTVGALEKAQSGNVRFAVDPSRGSILSLLVQTPSLRERIQLGGIVGYAIIALGAITFLLGFVRLAVLAFTHQRVRMQRRRPDVLGNNPLGRVLKVYSAKKDVDTETLERRLDESIIHETGRLERFLWAIKVVAVIAPLMGLLGTVTGMIRTFQAITLFGTGDPKLMASGISEALVTTMLGLVVAIPLVLLHSILSSISRRVTVVLEEQSAGMIATRAEEEKSGHVAA